jgi:hypothetical protein
VAIVLTASVAGSFTAFLAMFIGVGTGMLWTRPARDWFAGRPITAPASARPVERREQPEPPQPVAWLPPAPGDAQPPPTPGWGRAPETSADPAASWPAPTGWPVVAPVGPQTALDSPRPSPVRLACILTWVLSSLTAVGYALVLVVLGVDKSRFVDELKKSPGWKNSYDVDTVTTAVTVAAIVFVVWSVCAVVLAVLVWRRSRWAWVALLVSAGMAGLVSLVALPWSLPYLAVIGASTGLLMRASTRAWFAGPSQPGPPQPPAPRPPVW